MGSPVTKAGHMWEGILGLDPRKQDSGSSSQWAGLHLI